MDRAARKSQVSPAAPRRRRAHAPAQAMDAADGPLRGFVGYALRRTQLRVFDAFFSALSGEGITPARFSALAVIGTHPGISQAALAQSLDIARSGVVTLVDNLEEAGLVTREPIEDDRRAHALRLTGEGSRRLRALSERVEAHEASVCARLSAREKAQLLDLLARVG